MSGRGDRENSPEREARGLARRRAIDDLWHDPAVQHLLARLLKVRVSVDCARGHRAGITVTLALINMGRKMEVTGQNSVEVAFTDDGEREFRPALKLRCAECGRTVDRSHLSLMQDVLRVAAWEAARRGVVSVDEAAAVARILPPASLSKGQKKPAVII